jgi:hypothetical protein
LDDQRARSVCRRSSQIQFGAAEHHVPSLLTQFSYILFASRTVNPLSVQVCRRPWRNAPCGQQSPHDEESAPKRVMAVAFFTTSTRTKKSGRLGG